MKTQPTTWKPFEPGQEVVIEGYKTPLTRAVVAHCMPHFVTNLGGGGDCQCGWLVYIEGAIFDDEGRFKNYAHSDMCISAEAYDAEMARRAGMDEALERLASKSDEATP